ncbi:hypothetical protein CALVIDRAFT_267503 [Calocera viscosa TUFC12733]|uniref:Uncharacterized protein n=1 Tax=Calocera viscosa (strain TUFC12733) TaxID=1330018 RepID=A0A167IYA4_CALVF|nr:hypothetical protein CALVIDRAFT_267503 [Calocera viscosa TUFC12733]
MLECVLPLFPSKPQFSHQRDYSYCGPPAKSPNVDSRSCRLLTTRRAIGTSTSSSKYPDSHQPCRIPKPSPDHPSPRSRRYGPLTTCATIGTSSSISRRLKAHPSICQPLVPQALNISVSTQNPVVTTFSRSSFTLASLPLVYAHSCTQFVPCT